jgi:hypothetical protein
MALYCGYRRKTVKTWRDIGTGASVIAIAALWSGAANGAMRAQSVDIGTGGFVQRHDRQCLCHYH